MKIYTGFGDAGKTSLWGGKTVDKDHLRVSVYGTLDELNSYCGLLASKTSDKILIPKLYRIQNELFSLSSEIAASDSIRAQKLTSLISHTR